MSLVDDRQEQESITVWRYEDDKTKAKIQCDAGIIGVDVSWVRATWRDEGAMPIALKADGIGIPNLEMSGAMARRLCSVLSHLLAEMEAK